MSRQNPLIQCLDLECSEAYAGSAHVAVLAGAGEGGGGEDTYSLA